MFYLTTHSTHFIYGYMASDIWLRTILIAREETRCHHIGYSYRLTARVLLYAPSQRQDNTYHSLCYTSHGALAGTRNSSTTTRITSSGTTYRISNELSFITKFITWVGKHDIMWGSVEHNIIFANECNKFSNKWQRIWDFIYYITVKTIGISIFQL